MPLSQDSINWINSQPLSQAAKDALLADDSFDGVYKENVLTRADYSRRQNELKAEQDRIAAEDARLQGLVKQNTDWRATEEARLKAAIDRANAYENKFVTVRQKLFTDYNYDQYPDVVKDLGLNEEPVIAQPAPTNGTGTGGGNPTQRDYFTREELEQREVANVHVVAALQKLARQHQQLFGNYDGFDENELLTFALKEKHPSLQAAWEAKYNVPAKRDELREADVQRRITEGVATERSKWESEQALREQGAGQSQFDQRALPDEMKARYGQFDRLRGDTSGERTGAQGKQTRIDRALATSAKYRSGEIAPIVIGG